MHRKNHWSIIPACDRCDIFEATILRGLIDKTGSCQSGFNHFNFESAPAV